MASSNDVATFREKADELEKKLNSAVPKIGNFKQWTDNLLRIFMLLRTIRMVDTRFGESLAVEMIDVSGEYATRWLPRRYVPLYNVLEDALRIGSVYIRYLGRLNKGLMFDFKIQNKESPPDTHTETEQDVKKTKKKNKRSNDDEPASKKKKKMPTIVEEEEVVVIESDESDEQEEVPSTYQENPPAVATKRRKEQKKKSVVQK